MALKHLQDWRKKIKARCMSKNTLMENPTNNVTNKVVADRFRQIPMADDTTQVTYVWIDGTGQNLRAKSKTLHFVATKSADYPVWHFNGSSTDQANAENSDLYLYPVGIFSDPFRLKPNKLIICETITFDNIPTDTNHRVSCMEAMLAAKHQKPWFAFEQEYTILDTDGKPLGWPKTGLPSPQGPYYCGVGADRVFGRDIAEAHYRACLYSGINISGMNAEVMPSQWEFQIGPCEGIISGDQLWMARYILHRVAEEFGVIVTFDPKPVPGDWNGSGAHCNFSTQLMRKPETGYNEIEKAINKMSLAHTSHIEVYDANGGKDNLRRLTGKHGTCSINNFTAGLANRTASIRIPRICEETMSGFFEDRRPASNCDPYQVMEAIVRTVCLEEI